MKLDLSKDFDRNKAQAYFKKLCDKKAKIELKEFYAKRTLDQNAYFHVCVSMFADFSGYTNEEMKTMLKREFGDFMIYDKNGHKFLRSSAELDKMEMIEFVDWIRRLAAEQGCYIPTSEEYIQHQFDIEKQL